MSAMLSKHPNATKIARIGNMGGRNDTGEGDRLGAAERKPPVPMIKSGNGSRIEEGRLMEFRERVRNVFVIPVNLANPIHRRT